MAIETFHVSNSGLPVTILNTAKITIPTTCAKLASTLATVAPFTSAFEHFEGLLLRRNDVTKEITYGREHQRGETAHGLSAAPLQRTNRHVRREASNSWDNRSEGSAKANEDIEKINETS